MQRFVKEIFKMIDLHISSKAFVLPMYRTQDDVKAYFLLSQPKHLVGTQKNRLFKDLLSTHCIYFSLEVRKIILIAPFI